MAPPPPPPPLEDDEVPPLLEDDELLDDEELPEELEPLLEPVNVTIEFAGTVYVNAPLLTATEICVSRVCVAEVMTGVTDESVTPWRVNVWFTASVVLLAATIAMLPLARFLNAVMPIGPLFVDTSMR